MINAAFVRECKPRVKMYEVTCDALPGFILRVLPTGKKVALVRWTIALPDGRVLLFESEAEPRRRRPRR